MGEVVRSTETEGDDGAERKSGAESGRVIEDALGAYEDAAGATAGTVGVVRVASRSNGRKGDRRGMVLFCVKRW